MYLLERASLRDLPEVMRIASRSLTEQYDERFFLAMVESAGDTFVVARDIVTGRLVGFALAVRDSNVSSRLLMIAVDPPLRGRALGTRLLNDVERSLRLRGVLNLTLEVRDDNVAAIRFYHRLGYEIQGSVARYYQDGGRAVVMSKGL